MSALATTDHVRAFEHTGTSRASDAHRFDESRRPGHEARALAVSLAVTGAAVATVLLAWAFMHGAALRFSPGDASAPAPGVAAAIAAATAGPPLDPESIARGKTKFVGTCSSCHGPGGLGIKGLGKDLIHSEFTAKLSDQFLGDFIRKGRDPMDPLNTTKVAMPPKGGNPALNDKAIDDIIAFIRSLQNPSRVPTATTDAPTGS